MTEIILPFNIQAGTSSYSELSSALRLYNPSAKWNKPRGRTQPVASTPLQLKYKHKCGYAKLYISTY